MTKDEMAKFLNAITYDESKLCLLCRTRSIDKCTYNCPSTKDLLDEEWVHDDELL